jgi:D-amino-acid dehydrogenase
VALLLTFASRCNARDWESSARAKSRLLNDSRAPLGDWVRDYALACEFVESGEDYVFPRSAQARQGPARGPVPARARRAGGHLRRPASTKPRNPRSTPGVVGAIRFTGDAALRPDKYVAELARALRERGGEIVEGLRARTHRAHARWRCSACIRRRVFAKRRDVVIATGAWSPRLARAIGFPRCAAHAARQGVLHHLRRARARASRPLILRERSVCVTAWAGYRLGSTMEFSGLRHDAQRAPLAALERGAAEYLHEPVGPARARTLVRLAADELRRHPIIGAWCRSRRHAGSRPGTG